MNFQEELTKKTKEIEAVIREYLPAEEGFSRTMAQAMNYSMLAGGKRLRPMLMQETFRLFGGCGKLVKPFMAGMEMIHTHSLIHDDLPALDNDDYRRGRLTTHKVYGEAMGILSGVALLNYAYETMLQAFAMAETLQQKEAVIDALQVMAEKTGIHGMLGGQSVDVENDGKALEKDMLDYIYENKTAALIEASMMTGAILFHQQNCSSTVTYLFNDIKDFIYKNGGKSHRRLIHKNNPWFAHQCPSHGKHLLFTA